MPKSCPPYPREFRRRMIDLVRKGRTPEGLARQTRVSSEASASKHDSRSGLSSLVS